MGEVMCLVTSYEGRVIPNENPKTTETETPYQYKVNGNEREGGSWWIFGGITAFCVVFRVLDVRFQNTSTDETRQDTDMAWLGLARFGTAFARINSNDRTSREHCYLLY
mmetsp:Transcript_111284/g.227866  ORF Transcript_111284/g.227866 Transcript_111284/m.227866 type:complete len:109 (-) Transcript_111284:149-475(-)